MWTFQWKWKMENLSRVVQKVYRIIRSRDLTETLKSYLRSSQNSVHLIANVCRRSSEFLSCVTYFRS